MAMLATPDALNRSSCVGASGESTMVNTTTSPTRMRVGITVALKIGAARQKPLTRPSAQNMPDSQWISAASSIVTSPPPAGPR